MGEKNEQVEQLQKEVSLLKKKVAHIEAFLASFTRPDFSEPSLALDDHDERLAEAAKVVGQYRRASASLLQRCLDIGYARAARIIDQLEVGGLISPSDGTSKPRGVYQDKIKAFLEKNG